MTEDQIPKFLRRTPENEKKELSRFANLIDIYESKFHDFPPTEPSVWEEELWCVILEMCIKEDKTVDELLGFDSEELDDVEY